MNAITINLGKVLITPQANQALANLNHPFSNLLDRHALCDWSEMDAEDIQANRNALTNGGVLFSAYTIEGIRFWIITEANKSSTTIFLAGE
jgi:hypothetical protein